MKVELRLELEAKGTVEEQRKVAVMKVNFVGVEVAVILTVVEVAVMVMVAVMVTVGNVAAVWEMVVELNVLVTEEAENVLAGEKIDQAEVATEKG